MNLTISCPACKQPLHLPDNLRGQAVKCPSCTHVFATQEDGDAETSRSPSRRPSTPPPEADYDEPRPSHRRSSEKHCVECGSIIRARAELCPNCGVRQPYVEEAGYPIRPSRDGVKIPLLISAISNIVVGLLWASSCIGIVFTVPMIILCVFELKLWSNADSLPLREFGRRAKTLGIFEIVVGLANTPTLVCGILVLINAGKMAQPRDFD
jgi:uncharacterized Zn finger protein (UPF0148 family)